MLMSCTHGSYWTKLPVMTWVPATDLQLLPFDPARRAGFTLRGGGASEGAFFSANFGDRVGDAPAAVERNWQLLAQALAVSPVSLASVRQVHGARVRVVTARQRDQVPLVVEEADALVTREQGVVLTIRVADCAPVLLLHDGVVGAAHAGWRGTALGVVANTVAAMQQLGAGMSATEAFIGPHIRVCCFEVGEEVERAFAHVPGAVSVAPRTGKAHVDLSVVLRSQLEALGVQRISDSGFCTSCDPVRFYSHRRDKGTTGRHVAFVRL